MVEAVKELVKDGPWSGTATKLLAEVNRRTPESVTQRRSWFSKPRQVSDALRRLAPGLRRVGIEVTFVKVGRSRTRLVEIRRFPASAASAASAAPVLLAEPADDADDADELKPILPKGDSDADADTYRP